MKGYYEQLRQEAGLTGKTVRECIEQTVDMPTQTRLRVCGALIAKLWLVPERLTEEVETSLIDLGAIIEVERRFCPPDA